MSISKNKILIVDDEEILSDIYRSRFEIEGFEVRRSNNGEEALVVAKEFQPDLILIDLMMPKVDGYSAIKTFREMPETKDTYIIIYSALTTPSGNNEPTQYGANEFYVKSDISSEDLVERVKTAMRGAQTSVTPDAEISEALGQSSDQSSHE